jgi:excisionase family DNA binding protein
MIRSPSYFALATSIPLLAPDNGVPAGNCLSSAPPARADTNRTDLDTMNLEEFALRMGISLTVAYELARKNELPVPVIRIGRQYRFSRRAFEALMNGQHNGRDAGIELETGA